jgi:hypothetical protein
MLVGSRGRRRRLAFAGLLLASGAFTFAPAAEAETWSPAEPQIAVAGRFILRNVRGDIAIPLAPDQAAVIVIVPAGGEVRLVGRQLQVNGTPIDYRATRLPR